MAKRLGWVVSILAVMGGALGGCSMQAGPNDPEMSPKESARIRENAYTPDQQESRSHRPR